MTVALQHAKTGGKDVIAPDLLQRLIEVLQRRLAGLAAEKLGEGDSAAEDVRQLLGATKVGDVARVVLKLAVSAGSSVLEVTAASTRPFDGWSAAQQPGTAHGKQGKDNRSAQAMAAAKAAHLAMSPAAWLKQPGAPILSSLPFSLWGFGCRTEVCQWPPSNRVSSPLASEPSSCNPYLAAVNLRRLFDSGKRCGGHGRRRGRLLRQRQSAGTDSCSPRHPGACGM